MKIISIIPARGGSKSIPNVCLCRRYPEKYYYPSKKFKVLYIHPACPSHSILRLLVRSIKIKKQKKKKNNRVNLFSLKYSTVILMFFIKKNTEKNIKNRKIILRSNL